MLALELVRGDIPVVHDIHDLQSLRATPYRDGFPEPAEPLDLERTAIEGASALITVHPSSSTSVRARYELPARTLVLGNLALRRDRVIDLPIAATTRRAARSSMRGAFAADGGHIRPAGHLSGRRRSACRSQSNVTSRRGIRRPARGVRQHPMPQTRSIRRP